MDTSNNLITNIFNKDPFAEQNDELSVIQNDFIHVRLQQRNGKKTLTTIQGICEDYDLKKVTKSFKKEFACNGCVINHPEFGEVVQLQGDQRENVKKFLILTEMASEDIIKVHGF
jgi:translation initiation factor 1